MAAKKTDAAKGALAWQWVRAVRAATNEFRTGLRALDHRAAKPFDQLDWEGLPADDDVLFEITKWLVDQVTLATCDGTAPLGSRVGNKFAFRSDQLEALLAIRDRTRSPVYHQESTAAPLASWYIESAARHVNGLVATSDPNEPTLMAQYQLDIRAGHLVRWLALRVHSGFSALEDRSEAVLALLRRFQPDRQRRRTKAGEPSKLSADGILELLNDLAGRPLGDLTANSIAASKRRAKQAGEP